jgi:hypothetical protein
MPPESPRPRTEAHEATTNRAAAKRSDGSILAPAAGDLHPLARPCCDVDGSALNPLTEDFAELANDLRCSRRHVEAMDRDGRLGPVPIRLGRRRVLIRSEIREWLAHGAPDRVTWLEMRGGRS